MPDLSEMTEVLVWVAGALLVLAGTAKLRWPGGTATALAEAGLPSAHWLVRLLGALEVTTGAGVLVAGGRVPAAAATILYAAFAVFVVRRRRSADASCGCFGEARTPVGGVHVVVNVVAAVAAAGAAVTAARSPAAALGPADPVTVVGTIALVAVAAWLVQLGLTAGADLRAALALHPREETST